LFGREYQDSGGRQTSRKNIERESERFSTSESGAQVAEKPTRQARRFVAVSFDSYFAFLCLLATIIQKSAPGAFLIR
jgi:hypothetical protein